MRTDWASLKVVFSLYTLVVTTYHGLLNLNIIKEFTNAVQMQELPIQTLQ